MLIDSLPVRLDDCQMCNHYQLSPERMKELQIWQDIMAGSLDDMPDTAGDVWPKRQGLTVTNDGAAAMQWGVPLKMKGKRPGTTVTKRITNVRNLASPFWRSTLDRPENRCLVPFSRFAEPKPNAGRSEVWFAVNGAPVAAFAGIWRDSDEGRVYAFLTCAPNPLVQPIHPKAMPVILQPEDYRRWLEGESAAGFQEPFPSQLMGIVDND